MPRRKRASDGGDAAAEPAKPARERRSSRKAAAAATVSIKKVVEIDREPVDGLDKVKGARKRAARKRKRKSESAEKTKITAKPAVTTGGWMKMTADKGSSSDDEAINGASKSSRAVSEDPDVDSIPAVNPEAPRHDGEWYWLMKAEPESRFENGIDVKFSIDDLRLREKPEGWDGVRAYGARNHMRHMNVGDKAFFYHSNCKEPGIVGVMEIVKEFSEDSKSFLRPPFHIFSSKDNVRWSLVHVEFVKKFAVPIGLKELRELGKPGGPLENMEMLKQGRLSVSRVSAEEWQALCGIADKKAEEAGLKHETN
ncbi:thymocyte nuclear 1 [Trichoderma cornu-damae]|uniref:Thymocyte nuclear protein 1 n=1 Tax=Trichoderma cornu-damae TaxID=654480 RepID=A0A9P8QRP7_9HYPO|nr:thymocyte nuclear 1 [Trichoderma cornu-damae]